MIRFKLKSPALFVLFITSYSPLLLLLILKQLKQNILFLKYGGFGLQSFYCFIQKFGLSTFFIIILIIGFMGFYLLLNNIKRNVENGYLVKIKEIENKNSEAIGYISTYIVPFLFQDTNDWFGLFSIILIFTLIYSIYTKTTMIVINPILSIWLGIYQISYIRNDKTYRGFLLTKNEDLEEEQEIKINSISNTIYYGY